MIFFLDQYTIHGGYKEYFEAIFDTTKISTGSTADNLLRLPITSADGLLIDWGDGTVNSSIEHTYTTAGAYNVRIDGNIYGWRYNNLGDRLKLMEILSWGKFFIQNDSVFFGCANLKLDDVNGFPIISTTTFYQLFRGCSELVKVNNINLWDTSIVTNMQSVFYLCLKFNDNINDWNVSNVTTMQFMFSDCGAYNQPLDNWDVSKVTNMNNMFTRTYNFNQNIGMWNVESLTTATAFMNNKTSSNYSASNLNAIYNGWSARNLNSGVIINFGSIKYTSAGQTGRDILTTTYGWTITDGGI